MKYLKIILNIGIIVFLSFNKVFSQEKINITGRVVDSDNNPIEFVNVILLTTNDSNFVCGNITDSLGLFSLPACEKREYIIKLSCVGYEPLEQEIKTDFKNLIFTLNSNNINLKEVVVTGNIPIFKLVNGNIISRIDNTVLSSSGTANDVLDRLPGIYKLNDKYVVFGKTKILIYVNDKEVRSLEQLDRIRSEDILSVETINNPNVKYAGDVEAVIKIKTKNLLPDELGVNARLRGTAGRLFSNNELVNITYQKNKFDFFLSLYSSNARLSTDATNSQEVTGLDTLWFTKIDAYKWKQNYNYASGEFGMNYNVSPKQRISIGYNYSYNNSVYGGIGLTERYANNNLFDHLESYSSSTNNTNKHLLNLVYSNQFSDKLSLETNIDYLNYNSDRNQFADVQNTHSQYINTINSNLIATKLLFEYNFNEQKKLSFGGEQGYIDAMNNYISNDSLISNSKDNTKETRYAVFIGYQTRLKKMALEVGVRYENFQNNYNSDTYKNFEKTYNNLFPSFNLSFPMNKITMSLSFSEKINRPGFYQLRSGTEYVSRYLYEKGNPALIPENSYNITCNMLYDFIQFTINYRYIKNYIASSFQYLDENRQILVGSEENFPKYSELGFFLSFTKKIKIWNPNWNLSLIQPYSNSLYGSTTKNHYNPLAVFSLNNVLLLPQGYRFNVDGLIQTSGYIANIYLKPQASLNAGIRKSFYNDKLNIDIKFNDIFASRKDNFLIDNKLVIMRLYRYQDTRNISVSLTYKFYNYNKKYEQSNAATNDLNRF